MIYDRILTVYDLTDGDSPLSRRLIGGRRFFYGERTVGVTRFWAAKQAGEQVDMVVELPEADIMPTQYCVPADGKQYRILQVQAKYDDDGLAITLLSLRRMENFYDIA